MVDTAAHVSRLDCLAPGGGTSSLRCHRFRAVRTAHPRRVGASGAGRSRFVGPTRPPNDDVVQALVPLAGTGASPARRRDAPDDDDPAIRWWQRASSHASCRRERRCTETRRECVRLRRSIVTAIVVSSDSDPTRCNDSRKGVTKGHSIPEKP